MTISDRKSEEQSYSRRASNDSKELTPEVFGHIVAYAWLVFGERYDGALNEERMFDFLLWEDPEAFPPRIREMLRLEGRVDGSCLKEQPRLVIAAQSAYAFGLLMPDLPVSQLDSTQGAFLLRKYQSDFPEEVTWVCRAIAGLNKRRSAT